VAAVATAAAGFPPPGIHDEFSYLLAGDLFASGRTSAPTHEMWRHFETFHVLQVPSYASKYPPAQGVMLAVGQRLTGMPIVGVWISCALLVAAFNWMLQAWVRPRWALWGAVAAALWLTGAHAHGGSWMVSYWGGSVAALGGALVFGGIRRLAQRPTAGASIATAVGLAVLANSRPFEGLLFAVVPAIGVAWILVRQLRARDRKGVANTLVPMTLVLGATIVLMGWYNASITGSPTKPPYLAYDDEYTSSPHLLFQSTPPAPAYRVPVMERFHSSGNGSTEPPRSAGAVANHLWQQTTIIAGFYAPWFVMPLVFTLAVLAKGPWTAMVLASVATTVVAGLLILYPAQPHYVAPAAGAWCIALTLAARSMAQLRFRTFKAGHYLAVLVFGCIVASAFLKIGVDIMLLDGRPQAWPWQRQAMERTLATNGQHLIVVEYGPDHEPDQEWVYNSGDIDGAPVVWARSLGDSADLVLRRYFSSRNAWRLRVEPDSGPFVLTPLARVGADTTRQAPVRP